MPCTSMSMSHHVVPRLRALTRVAFLLAAVACNSEEIAGSLGEADVPPDATPAVESPATLTPEMLTSATAPGIPFGDFHLPSTMFSSTLYSGSLQRAYTSSLYDMLNKARSNSERVVLAIAGPKDGYKNSDGTFSFTKWKAKVAVFKGYNLGQYVTSGTLLGHYLIDEPFCTGCWGGRRSPLRSSKTCPSTRSRSGLRSRPP